MGSGIKRLLHKCFRGLNVCSSSYVRVMSWSHSSIKLFICCQVNKFESMIHSKASLLQMFWYFSVSSVLLVAIEHDAAVTILYYRDAIWRWWCWRSLDTEFGDLPTELYFVPSSESLLNVVFTNSKGKESYNRIILVWRYSMKWDGLFWPKSCILEKKTIMLPVHLTSFNLCKPLACLRISQCSVRSTQNETVCNH